MFISNKWLGTMYAISNSPFWQPMTLNLKKKYDIFKGSVTLNENQFFCNGTKNHILKIKSKVNDTIFFPISTLISFQ